MKIIQTNDEVYLTEIISLYIETFSKGILQQDIDLTHLTKYVEFFLTTGYTMLAIEENKVIGVLLAYNLGYDKCFPIAMFENIDTTYSDYIAEVMVKEENRGKGIGKQLIESCFDLMKMNKTTDVYIRVWDRNIEALTLYKKLGFEPFTTIEHRKTKGGGKEVFTMKKIYLHKNIIL